MQAAEDAFKVGDKSFNTGSFIIKSEGNPADLKSRLDAAATELGLTAVAVDIVQRYDVDGLHLDLIRYPSSAYSFDPYTMQAYSDALQISPTLTITAWRPITKMRRVSQKNAQITVATPTKPSSSPITASRKSVCASGR